MPEEFLEKFTIKSAEIGAEMKAFAEMAQRFGAAANVAKEKPEHSFKAMMILIKTGKQARVLADKLFEYSELMEDLEDTETDA